MITSPRVARLRQARFGSKPSDRRVYEEMVGRNLREGMRVVDVGCGRGRDDRVRWDLLPRVELIGLDPDPGAAVNPDLSAFHLLPQSRPWPLPSGHADLVTCRYVLEHVADPRAFFSEVARVLSSGGRCILLTPNRHYPPMIVARLLPHRLKQRLLAKTGHSAAEDVFPAYYRANTRSAIVRLARASGLTTESITIREYVPTRYLDWTLPGFLLAWAYHAVLMRTPLERHFGASVLAILRKP